MTTPFETAGAPGPGARGAGAWAAEVGRAGVKAATWAATRATRPRIAPSVRNVRRFSARPAMCMICSFWVRRFPEDVEVRVLCASSGPGGLFRPETNYTRWQVKVANNFMIADLH